MKGPSVGARTTLTAAAATAAALLAGCSARTEVSMSGNAPAQYSHVYVTVQEIRFNTRALATADDGGWLRFRLSAPVTVDLVTQNGGNLASLVTGLKLAPGTYSQLRLIPVDPAAPLTASAQAAGAVYNAEADYVDSADKTQQLPLELLNPEQGIGIQASLKVPVGALGTSATTNGNGTQNSATGLTLGIASNTATTTTGSTTPSGSQSVLAQFTVDFDGARDLVPFTFRTAGSTTTTCPRNCGVLLNAHPGAYNMRNAGGISGQLTLTGLTGLAGSSGLPDIQVTAETLSADGTRHEAVLSTPVSSSGSFTLYPLPSSSTTPAAYDVVIHGPGIATIIVKSVKVVLSAASSSSATSSTATTTASSSTSSDVSANTVSLGTITPRAAQSFSANLSLATGAGALPAGALVNFYQTLTGSSEVPYVIALTPVDPAGRQLSAARTLSAATIDSGTYTASGSTLTLVSAAAAEGVGRYTVAASAPAYADGPLTTTVAAPATGTTTPVGFSLPQLALASGSIAGQLTVQVTRAASSAASHGTLLVSHEGALVASMPLDAALGAGTGTVTVSGLPAGTSTALYYLTVRSWDASGTVRRQFYPTLIDLSGSAVAGASITVD